MATVAIEFTCCFCSDAHCASVDLPEGWQSGGHDIEDAFCPKHSAVAAFRESQCPGCVSGWGECGLWRGFAFSALSLDDADFAKIRRGICPKRVNGMFGISPERGVLHDLDVSERAPAESGEALANSIIEYCARYHRSEA